MSPNMMEIWICAIPSVVAAGCAISAGHRWSRRSKAQRIIFWTMLMLAVGSIYLFIFQFPAFQRFHRLDWILTTIVSFIPAMYYTLVYYLAAPSGSKRSSAVYIIPGVVAFINLVIYMLMGDKSSGDYLFNVIIQGHLDFSSYPVIWLVKRFAASYLFRFVLLSQAVYILVVSGRNLYEFHKELEDYYTVTGSDSFVGVRIIRISGVCLLLSVGLFAAVPYSVYSSHSWYVLMAVLLVSVGEILITIYVRKQKLTAETLAMLEGETANLGRGLKTKDTLVSRLEELVKEEFYTDPEVTIMSLSEKLSTNRTFLTEAIHKNYGMSFSNFVNDLRIKKAIEEMRTIPVNSPLTRLAEKCGYTSYSSFARNFEMFAHCTPSEWMKRYR